MCHRYDTLAPAAVTWTNAVLRWGRATAAAQASALGVIRSRFTGSSGRAGSRSPRLEIALACGLLWTAVRFVTRALAGHAIQPTQLNHKIKIMLDHYQQTNNVLVSYSTKALGFF
jgi:hypothetical protein